MLCCFQWFKDTNLKANHNKDLMGTTESIVVSNGSKILIWKQITTGRSSRRCPRRCFQWFKDTNLKANHNEKTQPDLASHVVSNGSKILIWKQITTLRRSHMVRVVVVSNGSKILIWKQITTGETRKIYKEVLFPMVQRY